MTVEEIERSLQDQLQQPEINLIKPFIIATSALSSSKDQDGMKQEIIKRAHALKALNKDIDAALESNDFLRVRNLYDAYGQFLNPYVSK